MNPRLSHINIRPPHRPYQAARRHEHDQEWEMGILSRKMTAAVVGAAVIGGIALSGASALAAPNNNAAASSADSVAGGGSSLDVISAGLDIGKSVYEIITYAVEQKQNRPGYVKSLMEGTFHKVDEKYNVLIINTGNRYQANFQNIKFEAIAHRKGYPDFHIYVFESGTLSNPGPYGWENWAMVGVFDRPNNGGNVTFHKFS
jgi:hypothetical protein